MNKADLGVLEIAVYNLRCYGEMGKEFYRQAGGKQKITNFIMGKPMILEEGERLIRLLHEICPDALIEGIEYTLDVSGSLDDTDLVKSIYQESGYTYSYYYVEDYDGGKITYHKIHKG